MTLAQFPSLYRMLATMIQLAPHPRLRASLLRLAGASVGKNARIHNVVFINPQRGFSLLHIGDGAYLGTEAMLDLAGPLSIGDRTTISARAILLTHNDPGSAQGSALCRHFPARIDGIAIGEDCWIGAGAIVLAATQMGANAVLAAGSVGRGRLCGDAVHAGAPARPVKTLNAGQQPPGVEAEDATE